VWDHSIAISGGVEPRGYRTALFCSSARVLERQRYDAIACCLAPHDPVHIRPNQYCGERFYRRATRTSCVETELGVPLRSRCRGEPCSLDPPVGVGRVLLCGPAGYLSVLSVRTRSGASEGRWRAHARHTWLRLQRCDDARRSARVPRCRVYPVSSSAGCGVNPPS
jgi:hypothetical protein